MKHCPKCNSLMPDDAVRCIKCGSESPAAAAQTLKRSAGEKPVPADDTRSPRRINWLRIFAAVLTSKLFFLVSCTSGMLASPLLMDSDDYGPAITASDSPSKLVVVIASVPDAGTEGGRKPVTVFLASLDEFKGKNPDYSFLLPPGKGQIENRGAEMLTDYQVTPSGPGTIIVKAHFHHDVPPVNLDVRARYEATDKNIKLLNVKAGSDFGRMLITGFIFATILAVTGRLLKKRFGPENASPDASSSSISRPKTGILFKIMAVIVVVVLVVAMLLSMV